MREICAALRETPDYLRSLYLRFVDAFKMRGLKNVHSDYVAAVAVGDYLAETIIFGTDAETAEQNAIECGVAVYAMNTEQLSDNAVTRAWEFTQGWLVSNEARFNYDTTPYYGRIEQCSDGKTASYYVIPQYLDNALEDAGFNVKKTMQGFREQGKVITFTDHEGKVRTKKRVRVNGNSVSVYHIQIERDGTPALGGRK